MFGGWRHGLRWTGAAVLAGALLGPFPSLPGGIPAAPAALRPATPPATSAAFTVRGSHGFSIDVESSGGRVRIIASDAGPPLPTFSRTGRPRLASSGNGASSVYELRTPPAPPRLIEAPLGELGRISVRFRPSGRKRVTRLDRHAGPFPCDGGTQIVRALGTFVGTVEFRGEGGYTSVETRRARGSVGTPLPAGCSERPHPSGRAVLHARDREAGTRFRAKMTDTGVAFLATRRERLDGGVVVTRRAYAGCPPDSFSSDADLSAARVWPFAPFSGVGRYRAGGGRPRWSGNLRATFPGGTIPLTGPGFRADLGAGG